MPVDKTQTEKLREAQEGKSWKRTCSICVRQFYDSLIGPCPEREGRQVCMYCCRLCQHSYKSRLGGRGCRVKDAARGRRR